MLLQRISILKMNICYSVIFHILKCTVKYYIYIFLRLPVSSVFYFVLCGNVSHARKKKILSLAAFALSEFLLCIKSSFLILNSCKVIYLNALFCYLPIMFISFQNFFSESIFSPKYYFFFSFHSLILNQLVPT